MLSNRNLFTPELFQAFQVAVKRFPQINDDKVQKVIAELSTSADLQIKQALVAIQAGHDVNANIKKIEEARQLEEQTRQFVESNTINHTIGKIKRLFDPIIDPLIPEHSREEIARIDAFLLKHELSERQISQLILGGAAQYLKKVHNDYFEAFTILTPYVVKFLKGESEAEASLSLNEETGTKLNAQIVLANQMLDELDQLELEEFTKLLKTFFDRIMEHQDHLSRLIIQSMLNGDFLKALQKLVDGMKATVAFYQLAKVADVKAVNASAAVGAEEKAPVATLSPRSLFKPAAAISAGPGPDRVLDAAPAPQSPRGLA